MKTKHILISALILNFFFFTSCSKDDDNNKDNEDQQTVLQKLTSGKWYFESKNPGSYTTCEKNGYIQFMTNGDLILNSFDDSSGACESLGEVIASYTLTNNTNLALTFGPDSQNAVIDSITNNELKVTNTNDGESLVFDKTQG